MTKNQIKPVRQTRTCALLRPAYTGAKAQPFFYGASMIALPTASKAEHSATVKQIRNITNHLRFYNQVVVRVSLYHRTNTYGSADFFRAYTPDVQTFATGLLDSALRHELDRELAVMARGENVAANQRRRRVLGQYLLSKPHQTIKNFYGASMQKLAAPAESNSESNVFHNDIIHERTNQTIYSQTQTQIERAAALPARSAAISDIDLNRIAAQAAKQVERKMRAERERNGKW